MRDLFPIMERLVTDSFRSVYKQIDPHRNKNSFEIFGYDFMIDENFKVYLIEANTNPCLEICCPLLARIIPELLDNSFRIAVDPTYQPPALLAEEKTDPQPQKPRACNIGEAANQKQEQDDQAQQLKNRVQHSKNEALQSKSRRKFELMPHIKYSLIFDELTDGEELAKLFKKDVPNQQLMAEIVEEEKMCEQVAKTQEQKAQAEQGGDIDDGIEEVAKVLEDDPPLLPPNDSEQSDNN